MTKKIPIARQLYNLKADPFQMDNLLATEMTAFACAELVSVFSSRLEELSACKGEDCRKPFDYPQQALVQCMAGTAGQ